MLGSQDTAKTFRRFAMMRYKMVAVYIRFESRLKKSALLDRFDQHVACESSSSAIAPDYGKSLPS